MFGNQGSAKLWLDIFCAAIQSGKNVAEAARIADKGSHEYFKRRPREYPLY